jgi:Na+-driven multidrug efflux pump
LLVRVVASFGNEALAGYVMGCAFHVRYAAAAGFSNAASTLVGKTGADKPERAESRCGVPLIKRGFLSLSVFVFHVCRTNHRSFRA